MLNIPVSYLSVFVCFVLFIWDALLSSQTIFQSLFCFCLFVMMLNIPVSYLSVFFCFVLFIWDALLSSQTIFQSLFCVVLFICVDA